MSLQPPSRLLAAISPCMRTKGTASAEHSRSMRQVFRCLAAPGDTAHRRDMEMPHTLVLQHRDEHGTDVPSEDWTGLDWTTVLTLDHCLD